MRKIGPLLTLAVNDCLIHLFETTVSERLLEEVRCRDALLKKAVGSMSTDDVRTRIMQAAGPVFADKGFQSATVREICQAADVNLAAINYYFGDKERLYIETVKRAQRLVAERFPMPTWPAGTTAEDRLAEYVETLLTRMLDNHQMPWQSRLMMREILDPTTACQELAEEYFRPQFALLLSILGELGGDAVEPHLLEQFAFSIVGQCVYYRVGRPIVECLIPKQQRAEHYSTRQLAAQVTLFSLAAIRNWSRESARQEKPIDHRVAPRKGSVKVV
jgi:AcrR family transcriptional regulator